MPEVVICFAEATACGRAAEGLAGAGRRLADELGGELAAIVPGPAGGELTGALARLVDRLLVADQPELTPEIADYQPEVTLATLAELCRGLEPRAVLLGSDTYSQELTPRLAHRLGGCSMSDGVALALGDDHLLVKRAAYGGRAMAVFKLALDPAVVWLRARALPPAPETGHICEVERVVPQLPASAVRVVERHHETSEGVALEEARLVVAGGRGLGGPESFAELEQLAAAVGGAVGASRAACDEGWVPATWQIGQTGKKIAPELYLAIGISGAAQHLLGISDAKVIAAINTDAGAPIFKHSSFGIIEDFRKVVPMLIERLTALNE